MSSALCRWCLVAISVAAGSAFTPPAAWPAVLHEARIDITFHSARSCAVSAAYSVDLDAEPSLVHRLTLLDGATVHLDGVDGDVSAGAPEIDGRARLLHVTSRAQGVVTYRVRYRIEQPEAGAYRCPVWLPAAPTDGRTQAVLLTVAVPGEEPPAGAFPAFGWDGPRGSARLGHGPAFVRVPFGPEGDAVHVNRLMDLVALAALVSGTVLFAWRRRRG